MGLAAHGAWLQDEPDLAPLKALHVADGAMPFTGGIALGLVLWVFTLMTGAIDVGSSVRMRAQELGQPKGLHHEQNREEEPDKSHVGILSARDARRQATRDKAPQAQNFKV